MKKWTTYGIVLMALLLCTALLAPSCKKGADGGGAAGGKVIGVSLLKENDDFYKTLKNGLEEAAKNMGYQIEILSADNDEQKQNENMDALLLKSPVAIVICPVNSKGVRAIIQKAAAQEIPVFTADIAAENSKVVAHIASDNYQGGQLAAERMVKAIGKGGLVTMVYVPGTESVAARVKGFVDKGEELGLEFVKNDSGEIMKYDGNDDQQKSEEKATAAINSNPDLKGIFAANDNMAAGAEAAITSSGKALTLVGYDASPMAQKKIDGGGVWVADVMQNPKDIGKITIETIDKHLKGELKAGAKTQIIPVPVSLYEGK